MNIPTWEEFSLYLTVEKKMKIPATFYGKFEYIRDYFLSRPFDESNLKKMFLDVKQDLYYRQGSKGFAQAINEYIMITKLIAEFHGYQKMKQQELDDITKGGSSFNIALDDFLTYLQYDRKVKLHSGYKARFKYIAEFFKGKEFNKKNVTLMLQELRQGSPLKGNKPMTDASLNKYIGTCKYICMYLGLDFLRDYKLFRVEQPIDNYEILSDEEMRLIAECRLDRPDEYDNYRFKVAIYTLALCFMRTKELTDLQWSDYNGEFFLVDDTKTKQARRVPVPDKLKKMLDELGRFDHGYIFGKEQYKLYPDDLNLEIRRRCQKLGFNKHVTAYTFRHSSITLCLVQGGEANLPMIAKIAGHTPDTCYAHYTHFDVSHLKNAMELSHPLLRGSQTIETLAKDMRKYTERLVNTKKFHLNIEESPDHLVLKILKVA